MHVLTVSYIYIDIYRMSVYELPWPILSTHLTGVITVTEEEIIAAMKLVSRLICTTIYNLLVP